MGCSDSMGPTKGPGKFVNKDNFNFEFFWDKTVGQKSDPELFMKGYIKEICRESYKQGFVDSRK